ncbi:AbrB family transcriptional regulator [Aliiroseovarius subalbicans]|uniref:AbrB family transcriptional regulator n=1 Tax=Aliiroseovarius subalbicans TaxID=2925840 RepID=UPI001F57CB2D|nr:AbrB family transcriptional regulator [Aliiroseovarius subalbicans]MCI2398848.1 AbrB family transcriptional regulator [Aliiroseovarius subalbicans]
MHAVTRPRLTALIAAGIGAAVFSWLGVPLPFLLGPMMGCLLVALAGAPMEGMGTLGIVMRTILGVAIGASLTPDTLAALPGFAPTLLLIPVFIAVIGAIGYPFFRRVCGFDPATSFYSAMPGGLQDMLIFGEEAGGDVRAMSLIHATRILVLVTIAPILITLAWGVDLTAAPGQPASEVGWVQITLMTVSGIAGWKFAERAGLFGASILGPMILTTILSLSGVIQTRPPAEMIWAAQFFIGLAVGAKYAGITAKEIRVDIGAGLAYSVLLAVISILFFLGVAWISPADDLDVLLSFLPGGQGEMVVIAIVTGADLGFVVTHHLLRIFTVIIAAPIVARRVAPKR